jgi:RNA polymerase sigma-70 factor (ECF subfamily)
VPTASRPTAAEDRVVDWWGRYAARVQAYALRHVDAHAAQEVVSETFLVAWRRAGEVPDDALPWLLVVARNVIRHQHRAASRATALERRLNQVTWQHVAPGADVAVTERERVLIALARLPEKHREAVLLVAWDGLSREQAAAAAGCRVGTFDVRLSRARKQLAALLDDPDPTPARRRALASLPAPAATPLAVEPQTPGGTR